MNHAIKTLAVASAFALGATGAQADFSGRVGASYRLTPWSIDNDTQDDGVSHAMRLDTRGFASPLDLVNVYYDLDYTFGSGGDASFQRLSGSLGSWLDVGPAVFAVFAYAGRQAFDHDLPIGSDTWRHTSVGAGARIFFNPRGSVFAHLGGSLGKMLDGKVTFDDPLLGDIDMKADGNLETNLEFGISWRPQGMKGFSFDGALLFSHGSYDATRQDSDIRRDDTGITLWGVGVGIGWFF